MTQDDIDRVETAISDLTRLAAALDTLLTARRMEPRAVGYPEDREIVAAKRTVEVSTAQGAGGIRFVTVSYPGEILE